MRMSDSTPRKAVMSQRPHRESARSSWVTNGPIQGRNFPAFYQNFLTIKTISPDSNPTPTACREV